MVIGAEVFFESNSKSLRIYLATQMVLNGQCSNRSHRCLAGVFQLFPAALRMFLMKESLKKKVICKKMQISSSDKPFMGLSTFFGELSNQKGYWRC